MAAPFISGGRGTSMSSWIVALRSKMLAPTISDPARMWFPTAINQPCGPWWPLRPSRGWPGEGQSIVPNFGETIARCATHGESFQQITRSGNPTLYRAFGYSF